MFMSLVEHAFVAAKVVKYNTLMSYANVIRSKYASEWKLAMVKEIQSTRGNQTSKLVPNHLMLNQLLVNE